MRNHRLDPLGFEPVANPLRVITLVGRQVSGIDVQITVVVGDRSVFDHVGEDGGFVGLSAAHFGVQRVPLPVAEEMDFCRKTAPRPAESVILRFVRLPFFPPPAAQR